jgi:hypothetical protein
MVTALNAERAAAYEVSPPDSADIRREAARSMA